MDHLQGPHTRELGLNYCKEGRRVFEVGYGSSREEGEKSRRGIFPRNRTELVHIASHTYTRAKVRLMKEREGRMRALCWSDFEGDISDTSMDACRSSS